MSLPAHFLIASGQKFPLYHIVVMISRIHRGFAWAGRCSVVWLAAVFAGCVLAVEAGAEEGPVLWAVDFAQQASGEAPEFGRGLVVREEGGQKFLSKQNTETEFLFAKQAQRPGSANWIDYVFTVRFRETEKSTLTLVVKSRGTRGEIPYMQYYVGIRDKGFGLICHGCPKESTVAGDPRLQASVNFEDLGASVIPIGQWVTASVAVGDEVVKVEVDAGDGQERKAEFKVFPGGGGVAVLTRSPVDVLSASVKEAGAAVVAAP